MDKFILDMTDNEVLAEIASIVGCTAEKPAKRLGWITKDPTTYFSAGTVHNSKLYNVYNNAASITDYVKTLSVTSLRSRSPDLFSLIKTQKAGARVLEYGCGVSTHGIACAQMGCTVHIVDISERMLEIASARYQKRNLNVSLHTIENDFPTFDNDYFDTILCTDVLEHIPDPISLLKYFIKWLKIGGTVHLHASTMVNLNKGHLPNSIKLWESKGMRLMRHHFNSLSEHNYVLVNKQFDTLD